MVYGSTMLKLVLEALQKYKINCLKGWALKTYFSGHPNVCNIYFCCRHCRASFWHFDIANFGNICTFYPKLELVQDNETGQEKLGTGARGAKKRIWWKLISLRICHRRNSIRNLQQCCAENGIKTKLLRVGLFYLWEQSWAQFESGTMRGSRCPTFHFIDSLQI